MIIAIDGPSGAGKSTLGKMLASKLGLLYLDTGAMYRAATLVVSQNSLDIKEAEMVANALRNANVSLAGDPDNLRVSINETDVTEEIRTPQISQMASIVSAISEVRKVLVERQRELASENARGCVLDGRDIGTVVFPNADVKFYLTADSESRAKRRFDEDSIRGRATNLENTLAEIDQRDKRDVTREDSPLSIANDAIVIDTTDLDLHEAFNKMCEIVEEKSKKTTQNI
jgi:cytidylate kinase